MTFLVTIKDFLWSHKHYFFYGILAIIIAILSYQVYLTYTTKPVTYESQQQAETKEGVQKAAENANVKLSDSQAKQVVKEIQTIRETKTEPVYIVQTTGDKVDATVKEEAKKNKADFTIVTNPEKPDEVVDTSKLKETDKIELNQYNIQSYKPVIREISYAPQEKIVGFSISKKITKDGQYIGVGVDHDIDDNKTYVKVVYSW